MDNNFQINTETIVNSDPLLSDNPDKKAAFLELNNILLNGLSSSSTITEFYEQAQKIIHQVNIIYENIQCKTGCNRCCKFYASPGIHKMEWDYIREHIEKNFSEKDMRRIKRKLRDLNDNLRKHLEGNINHLNESHYNFAAFVFYVGECPFVHNNMCSIYEVRPLICRTFGYSLITKPEKKTIENVLTCVEEKDRWIKENEQLSQNNVYLPFLDYINQSFAKIGKNDQELIYNTIQYWLTEYFNEY